MAFAIRAATPEDAARLHQLHTTSVRRICAPHYAPEVIDGWLANRVPEGYLPPIERGDIFVVEDGGRIVGFGEATPGVVVACYVDPAMVRRGVGSAIMEHALVIARRGHDGPIRVEATTLRRGEVDVPYVLMARP